MDKAPDAFRTISDHGRTRRVPQHVLRFWETRFAQIKPMKRSGSRRYYRLTTSICSGHPPSLYGRATPSAAFGASSRSMASRRCRAPADASPASFGAVEDAQHTMSEDDGEAPLRSGATTGITGAPGTGSISAFSARRRRHGQEPRNLSLRQGSPARPCPPRRRAPGFDGRRQLLDSALRTPDPPRSMDGPAIQPIGSLRFACTPGR